MKGRTKLSPTRNSFAMRIFRRTVPSQSHSVRSAKRLRGFRFRRCLAQRSLYSTPSCLFRARFLPRCGLFRSRSLHSLCEIKGQAGKDEDEGRGKGDCGRTNAGSMARNSKAKGWGRRGRSYNKPFTMPASFALHLLLLSICLRFRSDIGEDRKG